MALIKKQVFLRSRDENLQQFLAKAPLDMRWGQPSSKDKPNTRARAEGKIIKPQKAVKSEPKSPWDDESDALDQGSDNSNTADDTTGKQIKLAIQDAWFEKSKGNPGPPGSGKRGRVAYKEGRRKETHERAMETDQSFREKAAKDKSYLSAGSSFATGAARRAIKDFDESEGGRKAFRRWHRSGSDVGERAREMGRADTAPYKKLTPSEARDRQGQDFDDEAVTIKGAVRDAWFEKGDVVPFESKADKEKREEGDKAKRMVRNYFRSNPDKLKTMAETSAKEAAEKSTSSTEKKEAPKVRTPEPPQRDHDAPEFPDSQGARDRNAATKKQLLADRSQLVQRDKELKAKRDHLVAENKDLAAKGATPAPPDPNTESEAEKYFKDKI